jgi:hypothetical protein
MSRSSGTSTSTSECSKVESLPKSPGGAHHVAQDESDAWTKCEDLAKVLDDLEQSIDDYPSGLLQLDSAVILRIRDQQSLDELHIDRLGRVFQPAKRQYLSALAAVLVTQSYLANLGPIPEPPPSSKHSQLAVNSNDTWSNIPTKTIKTLGIHLANATSVVEREKGLRKRAKVVEAALHVMVQKIMVLVCGRYDEMVWRTLKCLVETVEHWW